MRSGASCVLSAILVLLVVAEFASALDFNPTNREIKIQDAERAPEGEGEWPETVDLSSSSRADPPPQGDDETPLLVSTPPLTAGNDPDTTQQGDGHAWSSAGGLESSALTDESSMPSLGESSTPGEVSSWTGGSESEMSSESEMPLPLTPTPAPVPVTPTPVPPVSPMAPLDMEFAISNMLNTSFTSVARNELRTQVAQAANASLADVTIVEVREQLGFLGHKLRPADRRMRGQESVLFVVVRIAHVAQEMVNATLVSVQNAVQTVAGYDVRSVEVVPPPVPLPTPTPAPATTRTRTRTRTPTPVVVPPPPMSIAPAAPGQVDLHIVVVVAGNSFSSAEQAIFVAELARVLGVEPSQITIIRVHEVDLNDDTGRGLRSAHAGVKRHVLKNDVNGEANQTAQHAVSIEARVTGLPTSSDAVSAAQIVQDAVASNNGHLGDFEVSSVTMTSKNFNLPDAARTPLRLRHGVGMWVGVVAGLLSLALIL